MAKVIRRIAVGLLISVVTSLAAIFVLSEWKLRDHEGPREVFLTVPEDSSTIQIGRHLAVTRGCMGCHGEDLGGRDFGEEWSWFGRPVAPNLVSLARENGPGVLEAAIRQGVGRDGRALMSMPSYNYAYLTDSDVASIVAFLRAQPASVRELPRPYLSVKARWALLRGKESHMIDLIDELPELKALDADTAATRGEYIAMTTCNECHGLDLRGTKWGVPDLVIVSAYSREDFGELMDSGIALGGRELGLMTQVARSRFTHFSDIEVSDLYAFLKTLRTQEIPDGVSWRD